MISARRPGLFFSTAALSAAMMASPVAAQTWLENLLGTGKPKEAVAPPAPATPSEVAPTQPKKPAATAVKRPPASQPGGEAGAPYASSSVQTAVAAPPPTAGSSATLLTEAQAVAKANAYFNGLSSLVADFSQLGGDGRKLAGKLYLQRPGKLRFEYDEPSPIEVIADGSSVAVRDRKLATQDLYSIGQTPLKFLLRDKVEIGRDIPVTEVDAESDAVRLTLEDRSTLGGTSKITLEFDKDVTRLNRWRIIDPQGFQTTVTLANLDRARKVDGRLFVINYERMLDDRK